MKKIIYLMLILGLVFILNSCDRSTSSSDNKVTFSGVVKLRDLDGSETTSDEVTIAVFEKEIEDIAWDYRLNTPLVVTSTNEFGEFLYKAQDNENYYAYFLMDGYSVKGFQQKKLTDNIFLFEDFVIGGIVTNHLVLDGTHDLVIHEDVIFTETGILEIQSASRIRIYPQKKITVYGTLDFQSPVEITSNDRTYSYGVDNINLFVSFEIYPSVIIESNSLENVTCSWSNYGFLVKKDNIHISNSNFVNSLNGLYVAESNGVILNKIFSKKVIGHSNGGIYLEIVDNVQITNCTLLDNYNGIKVKEVTNLNINNTLFERNFSGFLSYYSTGLISHNQFSNNSNSLELLGNRSSGTLSIEYNNISVSDIGVYQHEAGSWNTFHEMIINNNNFETTDLFIKYDSSGIHQDLDATSNYFDGLTDENSIQDKIMNTSTEQELFIDVNVVPFKTRLISSAGIIQE